jgi:hypothetical protein
MTLPNELVLGFLDPFFITRRYQVAPVSVFKLTEHNTLKNLGVTTFLIGG